MSSPRFTPRQAVEHRLKARGLTLDDIRVGKKVLLTWTRIWGEAMADALEAAPAPQTMFGDTFWLRTPDNENGGVTVAFAPIGAPGTTVLSDGIGLSSWVAAASNT